MLAQNLLKTLKSAYFCANIFSSISLLPLLPISASAADNPPHQPQPCIGFYQNGLEKNWGYQAETQCPASHAFFATQSPSKDNKNSPHSVVAAGLCCPLPADDIVLADSTIKASDRCPENSIAVGAQMTGDYACELCTKYLLCAKINTKRYMLGPESDAIRVGPSSSLFDSSKLYSRGDLPLAIRYGINRLSRYSWASDSCVGFPLGSIQTAKLGKYCWQRKFRELQYRGISGDPAKGTAVLMYPNCSSISGIYAEKADCELEK